MYIAACQGQTTLGDKILMSTKTTCHFGHLLQVQKEISFKSDFIQFFFHFFNHVHSPGAGADNPLGMKFWCQRNILSLRSFVASLKTSLWSLILYIFFMILYMYIAPGQRQTAPRGQNIDFNRNVLSLHSFVARFKKCLWSLFLNYFFHDLIHVSSPGARVVSPQGTKFWCQQKGLITLPNCCKFQRNLFEVWFYTIFFHDLIHIYSPRAGGIQSLGTKFWCQQKLLVTSVIYC